MRLLCLGLVVALAILAAIVSNRAKPMVIEPHASGQWTFEHADFMHCVPDRPRALRPVPYLPGRKAAVPIA